MAEYDGWSSAINYASAVDNFPIDSLVKQFNKETKNGNNMSKYTKLLEKAVFDIKGVVEQKGIQSLFKMGQSTLLDTTVTGLNDFELISFLVIK